jgi:hypothetical protein
MTTFTVCIPCVDKHIEKMEKLLDSFKYYIIKPDKVIVSMSPRYLNLNLQAEKERLEKKFPFLMCLVQTKIMGMGENLNCIFNHIETEYITIWGADDFFHPQYFEIMNYIIKKYNNPNILTHSYDKNLTLRTQQNIKLLHDINVFENILLKNIKIYNDLFLVHASEDIYRFHSYKYMQDYKIKGQIWMHAGMQTLKSHIVKENKFKEGKKYDWKSDTLFLNDIFRKYRNMIFIDENMIQYVPSNTCEVVK